VTIADRASRWLKVVDSDGPLGDRSAVAAVFDTDPVSEADRADDDLVLLRGVELRPFLVSMVGFSDLIASGDLDDDQRLLYIGALLREGRRLTGLINNALALQRLEMGHRELDLAPVDLRALIQRAVLAAGKDEKRPIDVHLPEQLPLVTADAEAILEVLASFL
jgi:signal transduction histidine kinase